jgi:DNA-binding MarR family transcriptional regulator
MCCKQYMLTTYINFATLRVMKKRRQTAFDDGSTLQSDAAVLAVRLGDKLNTEVDAFFATWGVTALQFSVLRILYVRDPDRKGISRGAIEARPLKRMPDVTRLLDRLEAAGLIARHRPKDDQRTVLATLTDKGWNLVEQSHQPLLAVNRSQFSRFSKAELAQFIALLRKALDRPSKTAATAAAGEIVAGALYGKS